MPLNLCRFRTTIQKMCTVQSSLKNTFNLDQYIYAWHVFTRHVTRFYLKRSLEAYLSISLSKFNTPTLVLLCANNSKVTDFKLNGGRKKHGLNWPILSKCHCLCIMAEFTPFSKIIGHFAGKGFHNDKKKLFLCLWHFIKIEMIFTREKCSLSKLLMNKMYREKSPSF